MLDSISLLLLDSLLSPSHLCCLSSHLLQAFPNHYHPQLLTSLSHHHRAASRKRRHEPHSITTEEEEERAHYGGPSPSQFQVGGDRTSSLGSYCWAQRWKMLSQRVVKFEPEDQQRLNFAGTSCLPIPKSVTPQESGRSKSGRAKRTFEGESERKKRPWYEGPSDSGLTD